MTARVSVSRRRRAWGSAVVLAVVSLAALSACSSSSTPAAHGSSSASVSSSPAATGSPSPVFTQRVTPARAGSLARLLHPAQKYFGVSIPGVPASLTPLRTLASQIHKTPNVVSYYQDWTRPLDASGTRALCAAGVLPALTWESWSWNDVVNGSPAVTQPAYSPARIASGAYDSYIRSMAESIKALPCPVMLRLDQEPNGHWYPWGLATPGMHNTAAQYIAMWRHVWGIFHDAGVHNVLWTWSPNFLYHGGLNAIGQLYPGNKYVDIVGVDGYVLDGASPATLFRRSLTALGRFASGKPWIVSETGVASGAKQASGLTALLHVVATNPKLIGVVYLDQQAARANWTITSTPASTHAFASAIASSTYGGAPLKGL